MASLDDAQELALELMAKYGLSSWGFGFNKRKRTLGLCIFPDEKQQGRIEISEAVARLNSIDVVRQIIVHELAHALAGRAAGHGPVWQALCRALGGKPESRCSTDRVTLPEGRWRFRCPGCEKRGSLCRRPRPGLDYRCRLCKTSILWLD